MTRLSFSVIIPTFNRRSTIERALDSALAQNHPADEIIVVDDGSTDGTSDLLRKYGSKICLKTFSTNSGPSIARNCGIRHAKCHHLAFLDSDDVWHEDFLAAVADAWLANPNASIVYSQYVKIEGELGARATPFDVVVEGDQIEAMLLGNFIHSSSLMSVRRDWAVAVGGFDPSYRVAEDRAMYLRLLQLGPAVAVPRRLVERHVGHDNLTHEFERWWADSIGFTSHFLAKPEFARYRWLEDRSLADTWMVIHWHVRKRQKKTE